ncbi:MAG: MFS transporter [Ilumatobacteraceae bacterium]
MRLRLRHLLFGPSPVVPLSLAHGLQTAGDAFVTVSLAGSLFFNVSPDASREQVLLYLVVTLAPLAVLAPLVGPVVDRFSARPHWVGFACFLIRAACCLLLANSLYQLSFYAYAILLLVASRASGVVKQAMVPRLTDPDDLVATNARLARISSVSGGIGAAAATAILATFDAPTVLRVGCVAFIAAAIVLVRADLAPVPAAPLQAPIERAEMHLPTVRLGSIGFTAIRGAVGFFVFTMAFTLREASEPPWVYGAAIGVYGTGAFTGNVVTPFLRRRFSEQTLVLMAISAPASLTLVGILGVARPLLLAIAALIGLSTTLGRHAFDSILQHRAPLASRGRAGARYETYFSLAFVSGGVIATLTALPVQAAMAVLSAIYVPALIMFVRAFHAARRAELNSSTESLQLAVMRLDAAVARHRIGDLRTAIVEAAAAADLAQVADPSIGGIVGRDDLDTLRRRALDADHELTDAEADLALSLAHSLLTTVAATTS